MYLTIAREKKHLPMNMQIGTYFHWTLKKKWLQQKLPLTKTLPVWGTSYLRSLTYDVLPTKSYLRSPALRSPRGEPPERRCKRARRRPSSPEDEDDDAVRTGESHARTHARTHAQAHNTEHDDDEKKQDASDTATVNTKCIQILTATEINPRPKSQQPRPKSQQPRPKPWSSPRHRRVLQLHAAVYPTHYVMLRESGRVNLSTSRAALSPAGP